MKLIDRCFFFDFERKTGYYAEVLTNDPFGNGRMGEGGMGKVLRFDIDQASRDTFSFSFNSCHGLPHFLRILHGCILSSTCETKSAKQTMSARVKLCGKSLRDRLFPFCSSRFVPPMLTPSIGVYATDNDLCLATSIGRDSAVLFGAKLFPQENVSSSSRVPFHSSPWNAFPGVHLLVFLHVDTICRLPKLKFIFTINDYSMPFEKFQSVVKILIFLEQLERKKKKRRLGFGDFFFFPRRLEWIGTIRDRVICFPFVLLVGRDRNFLILRNCVNRKFRNRKA